MDTLPHQHRGMRLTDELAARRHLYGGPVATMPDILIIDVPARFASPSLPLGRYYPIIIENALERIEVERFLTADRDSLVVPDLLDRRQTTFFSAGIVFCRYPAPAVESPWLLLCYWPDRLAGLVKPGSDLFARGHYTIEILASLADLKCVETRLLQTLGSEQTVRIFGPAG